MIALNHLYGHTGLTLEALAEIGLTLGSDVPVSSMEQRQAGAGRLEPVELPKELGVRGGASCRSILARAEGLGA